MVTPAGGRDDLGVIAVISAAVAVLLSVVGVGLGLRAIDGDGDGGGGREEGGAAVEVALTDFRISPGAVEIASGGALNVTNRGQTPHDLTIAGTDLTTGSLAPKASAAIDAAALEPGEYAMFCSISGHRDAGMEGRLEVSGAAGDASGHDSEPAMSADDMDEVMAKRTKAFPAKTDGLGGQLLEPTVLPDGTKRFELTAKVVDWELEPGKKVKAWTYNGTVPGPTIRVAVGDRIEVALRNELPQSTAIHFHGLRTPNAMDGVPDITQAPIKPGATFTYAFVARGPAVGMYHSHHNAAEQVPNGLAATILVGDLPLPAGVTVSRTYPMMLNDAGVIGLSLNGKSFPATEPVAVKPGEWVLVHYLNEGLQAHPMHLHGLEQLVVAKDGMPVPQPYRADTVNVAPGERYSVLVHADEPGVWAWHCHILTHAERADGMFGMVTAMVVK